jgi:methylmalonyl-CoA mutase
MNIATRREVLLGTNQYPNNTEKVHEDFNPAPQKSKKDPIKTFEVKKLEKYRGSEAFEELRLKVEKSSKEAKVFLLTYGNLNWRKARAGFASGFFACAGFNVIDNLGFKTVKEGMTAASKAGASIIVLCSSDEEYEEMAKEAVSLNKNNAILVIAGYPKDSIEKIMETGINDFIHVKSNLLEDLRSFCDKLGIN